MIRRIAAGRMTIVVTHQLENTQLADRILVMREGHVIEHGGHEELADVGGVFAELVALASGSAGAAALPVLSGVLAGSPQGWRRSGRAHPPSWCVGMPVGAGMGPHC
ncbi:hypothetical protein [Streptomyces melanosporofaciens]|uniref:hypothetical protein n=1 Tax=Streptomyces melanosporofaciens TaxID=67327 RepID=UPI000B8924B4|nr:hypothetical protein [Streptomyces melanosporofaciens]